MYFSFWVLELIELEIDNNYYRILIRPKFLSVRRKFINEKATGGFVIILQGFTEDSNINHSVIYKKIVKAPETQVKRQCWLIYTGRVWLIYYLQDTLIFAVLSVRVQYTQKELR